MISNCLENFQTWRNAEKNMLIQSQNCQECIHILFMTRCSGVTWFHFLYPSLGSNVKRSLWDFECMWLFLLRSSHSGSWEGTILSTTSKLFFPFFHPFTLVLLPSEQLDFQPCIYRGNQIRSLGPGACFILCERSPALHLNMVLMGNLLLILITQLAMITATQQRQILFQLPLK